MDKLSMYFLQRLDCNCNVCGYFKRDMEKTKQNNTNVQLVEFKIHYGRCERLNKDVAEIANITLLHTQKCFKHRIDFLSEEERQKKLS